LLCFVTPRENLGDDASDGFALAQGHVVQVAGEFVAGGEDVVLNLCPEAPDPRFDESRPSSSA
jgi:hypothetical protein